MTASNRNTLPLAKAANNRPTPLKQSGPQYLQAQQQEEREPQAPVRLEPDQLEQTAQTEQQ